MILSAYTQSGCTGSRRIMKKSKNKNIAFAIYVVLFMVLWNIIEMLWRSLTGAGAAGRPDIVIPLIVAIVTGYLFFVARGVNINDELKEARKTDGAVIVDVRGADEYAQGHIPGAVNVPGENIDAIISVVPDRNTPLFTYCLRGSRSSSAARALKKMGYVQVINMGGIDKYKGEIER